MGKGVHNTPEPSTWEPFDRNLPTCLTWVGCEQVAQRVHLLIHIKLLVLQFENSIVSYQNCIFNSR